jgi:hypothetical protein
MPFTGSSVHVHSVAGRSPGAGTVLAVFTDGPSDPVAAVRRLAGRLHAAVVVTAAPLPDPTGFLRPVSAAVTRDRATVRPEGRRSWSRP